MITRTHDMPSEIDFSTFPDSDGLPMADNEINPEQMIDLILPGKQALEPRGHHVGGNLLMYYDSFDGRKHLSPDVFVALDVDPAPRASWKTWVEGKFPEVVFEIASPSTRDRDIGEKVSLYGALGAREYYIFDPARQLDPPFRGYLLQGGRVALLPNPTGRRIISPLLELELRVVEDRLRLIDPETDAPYLLPLEALARAKEAMLAQREAEQRAAAAEARATAAEARLQELLARLAAVQPNDDGMPDEPRAD
ncbi:MAG TPA: Uma2 family endonuclease [Chloroflexota bacterium]|nr:Uma2 family endonuclease [Chloroflexota bacterium]